MPTASEESPVRPRWYDRIGPGLITACVVIGPGSILTSSRVGATYGYSMAWVVVLAVVFMLTYVTMAARIGAVVGMSMGDLLTKHVGRWLAVLLGVTLFSVASIFQYTNNLGVHSAFAQFIDFKYTVVIFNAMSILFLFAAKDLYQWLEWLMMCLVGVMLVSFAINLSFAKPSPTEFVQGLIPNGDVFGDLAVLGLIGTTFSIAAAYYQSYLSQQKGWGVNQLKDVLIDGRVSSIILAGITLMLMSTSAAVLQGKTLDDVGDVAASLEPLFGTSGKLLFCIGLLAASYSSFLVNSMVGGFILSDGLGLGCKADTFWPKFFTMGVLLTGMGVALVILEYGFKPVAAIVAGQAITVVASPLMAGVLLWVGNSKKIMGQHTNSLLGNIVAGIGFMILLAMAANTAINQVWPALQKWST